MPSGYQEPEFAPDNSQPEASLLLNPVLQAVVYTAIQTHSGPRNSSFILLPFPCSNESFIRKRNPQISLEFKETTGSFARGERRGADSSLVSSDSINIDLVLAQGQTSKAAVDSWRGPSL